MPLARHLPPHLPQTAFLLLIGFVGAVLAEALGLPLPFLLGPLLATAPVAIFASARLPRGYSFPTDVRVPFIALIGAVIGAQVTPELVASLHDLLPSLAAIIAFVLLAQGLNYVLFRYIGGYDATTAFYSGAPGGLIESIAMGEASGADQPTLIAQQFLRIIFVITLVPMGLSLWLGYPVGSAGGLSFNTVPVTPVMYPQAAVILGLGLVAGRALRLRATGPAQLDGASGPARRGHIARHALCGPQTAHAAPLALALACLDHTYARARGRPCRSAGRPDRAALQNPLHHLRPRRRQRNGPCRAQP